MTLETLRAWCLSFPGATEQIQWGSDLVFKVGGKMFCVAATEPSPVAASFKCDEETFADLVERDGVLPAPYLARAHWVAVEGLNSLPARELRPLVARAYELVRQKLPKSTQARLAAATNPPRAPVRGKTPRR